MQFEDYKITSPDHFRHISTIISLVRQWSISTPHKKSANHIVEKGVVTKRPSDPALRGGMDHQLCLLI